MRHASLRYSMEDISISKLKREAKQLKKVTGQSHSQALDALARSKGYACWSVLMADLSRKRRIEKERADIDEEWQPQSDTAYKSSYDDVLPIKHFQ